MSEVEISDEIIQRIKNSSHTVVITGAGVSAESGVPTFRDAQTGLWAQYEPTELATPEAFQRDPKLVWDWYASRRETVLSVKPNPGHFALAQLGQLIEKMTLITQNVDGLHQAAGSPDVIELHGSIMRAKCFQCLAVSKGWPDDSKHQPPKCQLCEGLMRPDVVWFNESLPRQAILEAAQAVEQCDLFFSIGTSSMVHPAASFAFTAVENQATVIEINPTETPLTPEANFVLSGPSGKILPRIVERCR